MTFSEKRNKLRVFRRIAPLLRDRVNAHGFSTIGTFTLTLCLSDYEALEFGLSHLKIWIPELDDECEVIPGRGKFSRTNMLYARSDEPHEPREHLIFKGTKVFSDASATPL